MTSIIPLAAVVFTAANAAGLALIDLLNSVPLHLGHGVLGGIALAALINLIIGE